MYPPPSGPHSNWYAPQQPKYYPPPMGQRPPHFSMPAGPTKTALNTMIHQRRNTHGHLPQVGHNSNNNDDDEIVIKSKLLT